MEQHTVENWVTGYRSLPRDIRRKIHLIQIVEYGGNKPPQYCGHENHAQCLTYWELFVPKINGKTYACFWYWNNITVKDMAAGVNTTIFELSQHCVNLFSTTP